MLGFFKNIFKRLKSSINHERYQKTYNELIHVFRRVTPFESKDIDRIHSILKNLVSDPQKLDAKMKIFKNSLELKDKKIAKTHKIKKIDLNRKNDVTYSINGNVVYGEVESDEELKYFTRDNVHVLNSIPFKPKICDFDCTRNECKFCLEKRLRQEISNTFEREQQVTKKRRIAPLVINQLNEELGLPSVFGRFVADEKFSIDELDGNEREEFLAWKSKQKEKTAMARAHLDLRTLPISKKANASDLSVEKKESNFNNSLISTMPSKISSDQLNSPANDSKLESVIEAEAHQSDKPKTISESPIQKGSSGTNPFSGLTTVTPSLSNFSPINLSFSAPIPASEESKTATFKETSAMNINQSTPSSAVINQPSPSSSAVINQPSPFSCVVINQPSSSSSAVINQPSPSSSAVINQPSSSSRAVSIKLESVNKSTDFNNESRKLAIETPNYPFGLKNPFVAENVYSKTPSTSEVAKQQVLSNPFLSLDIKNSFNEQKIDSIFQTSQELFNNLNQTVNTKEPSLDKIVEENKSEIIANKSPFSFSNGLQQPGHTSFTSVLPVNPFSRQQNEGIQSNLAANPFSNTPQAASFLFNNTAIENNPFSKATVNPFNAATTGQLVNNLFDNSKMNSPQTGISFDKTVTSNPFDKPVASNPFGSLPQAANEFTSSIQKLTNPFASSPYSSQSADLASQQINGGLLKTDMQPTTQSFQAGNNPFASPGQFVPNFSGNFSNQNIFQQGSSAEDQSSLFSNTDNEVGKKRKAYRKR